MGLRQRLQKSLGHRVWYGLTHDNHMGQVQWGQGVGQPQPIAGVENSQLKPLGHGPSQTVGQLLQGEMVGGVNADASLGGSGFAVARKKQNIPGLVPELVGELAAVGLN